MKTKVISKLNNKISYQEWAKMDYDWGNEYKLMYSVPSYFFRYDNYNRGKTNKHILKSTFGHKQEREIKDEIRECFDYCVGVYNRLNL